MILVPDTAQKAVYDAEIAPHLRAGHLLMFAHGFNIHFGRIDPPGIVDVGMVAPKGPGHLLRSVYRAGGGVPALFAVHRDPSGTARDRVLAYARAIGSTRAGVLETTFAEETETDLFGEQARPVRRHGGAHQDGLRDARRGRLPARARLLRDDARAQADRRPDVPRRPQLHALQRQRHGRVRRLRQSGPRIIDEHVRATMKQVLTEIQDGTFARNWIAESESGRQASSSGCARPDRDHLVERVGGRLRAQMPFLDPVEVVAGQTQASATTPGAAR